MARRESDFSGDESAAAADHAASWDAHAQRIYRYCFHRTGDPVLAEDLTSIVFLEAWRRFGEVAVSAEARLPWLYGVATNVLRNQRRSERRYRAAMARLPDLTSEPDFADSVSERVSAAQEMQAILEQLDALSEIEQEVLALCVWEGLTAHEAAAALSIPEATVRTRLHRARAHLSQTAHTRDVYAADLTQGDHP